MGFPEFFLVCGLIYCALEGLGMFLGWRLLERLPAQWLGVIFLAGAAALLVLGKPKGWFNAVIIGAFAIGGVVILAKWWRERK